jgi:hypothetical protein
MTTCPYATRRIYGESFMLLEFAGTETLNLNSPSERGAMAITANPQQL